METALKVMRLTTERPFEGLLPNSGRGLMDKRPEADHGHKRGADPETFLRNFCQNLVTYWMCGGKEGKEGTGL